MPVSHNPYRCSSRSPRTPDAVNQMPIILTGSNTITNISLATLHARRKEVRARGSKPSPSSPADPGWHPTSVELPPLHIAAAPRPTTRSTHLPNRGSEHQPSHRTSTSLTAGNHPQYVVAEKDPCLPHHRRRRDPITRPKARIVGPIQLPLLLTKNLTRTFRRRQQSWCSPTGARPVRARP